ncbi:MAG: bifunctional (p)ppGpp synthetase/guanosine-3',5'-bis(diphosphate) 3'-pyrophosphohydrolase [Gammaproteobacteria bacterium]
METAQVVPPEILASIAQVRAAAEAASPASHSALAHSVEAAEVIGTLTENAELANALVLRPLIGLNGFTQEKLAKLATPGAAKIAADLERIGDVGLPRDWSPAQGLDARQAETVRKMLLAVVSDPRLVLAQLAQQLVRLRHAKDLSAEARERLAVEGRAVLAPLANRLGVWQLKWELEDLAFRYLEPEEYKRIAAALNERRADRERYIDEVCETLRQELAKGHVKAQVYGRPKHIYSIYRKMERKHLAFEEVFDVRAVRIVVDSVPECYAALGIVHGLWTYIPGEFDDYIATPKGNFYRSIHTAVIGPQKRSVEVQIRTGEMHEHAELGVAAHWQYKEGGARDAQYERKIEWVRRLLEPQEASDTDKDFLERMRTELFEDRVYALTPKGEVVDLPRGATPLDFAYNVHTDLGHRCRGAKINGRIVPLDYQVSNGEIVEIITGKHAAPSRDWLAPEQGYLVSPRNRAKVRAWFRKLDVADNRIAGKQIAERELARLGVKPEHMSALVSELKANDTDHFHQLLGEGEITVTQLVQAAERLIQPPAEPKPRTSRASKAAAARKKRGSLVDIEGVGDLPITLARCCAPIRPQSITGYVTLGRGVTIHRSDCPALARMRAVKPERALNVEWSSDDPENLDVQIAVTAYDRRGFVRDISDVMAAEHLSIDALNTVTDHDTGTAHMTIKLAVRDLEQLARVLRRLSGVPNVISARRVH